MTSKNTDSISTIIVESAVKNSIKLRGTSSNGEAKIYLGPTSKGFSDFFNHFDDSNLYRLDKDNLKEFLLSLKVEYVYQALQQYKGVSSRYWEQKYQELLSYKESDLQFQVKEFSSGSRFYIRSQDRIFLEFVRSITLPHLTKMVIERHFDKVQSRFVYTFKFFLNEEFGQTQFTEGAAEQQEMVGRNIIFWGAPGTGKSHKVDQLYPSNKIRVTFHPEYSYYDFVGVYRPVPVYKKTDQSLLESDLREFARGEPLLDYRFHPGPFTLALEQAFSDLTQVYTLVIEEINRANVAAVFGDLFQLLDREDGGDSAYPVFNAEIARYLRQNQQVVANLQTKGIDILKTDQIIIPKNLNIVATMNSADQAVFVMDSAFKRRWDFEYVPIDFDDCEHKEAPVPYAGRVVAWKDFAQTINSFLAEQGVREDKHIGPYFMKKDQVSNPIMIASKLLFYLWDDVLAHKRNVLFYAKTFGELVEKYKNGEEVFLISFPYQQEGERA